MAISLQTQWTLVASGLVAHADHVLAGEECDRLMDMVEREVDGDEYAQWMAAIGDPAQLETLLKGLTMPPDQSHREILEEAWLMAVVDGERADVELQVLGRIAGKLGVDTMQLDSWREAWTSAQHGYADVAVVALAWILGGDDPVSSEDQSTVDDFVHALPTTHDHRDGLSVAERAPRSADDVERRVRELGAPQRRDLMRRLSDAVSGAAHAQSAKGRLEALSKATD